MLLVLCEVLKMILNEFDKNKDAVINPLDFLKPIDDMPKIAVTCFSRLTFDRLVEELKGEKIGETGMANINVPIYKVQYNNIEVALFNSPVGAAACIAIQEDLFALGVEKMVVFGTCGVLDKGIEDCAIIIPNRAVRDEGTSYHYAPASDEIVVNRKYQSDFIDILKSHKTSYVLGKVWTTDACYRETREKVNHRKASGCVAVDMECSAISALAEFRDKEVFQFFYAADNLDGEEWDARSLSNSANLLEKDRIALLAMEMAEKMMS